MFEDVLSGIGFCVVMFYGGYLFGLLRGHDSGWSAHARKTDLEKKER